MAHYTEVEWALRFQTPAADAEIYEFRVYAGSTPLTTYIVTPQLTVNTSINLTVANAAQAQTAAAAVLAVDLVVANTVQAQTATAPTLSILAPVIQEGFRWRNDDGSETAATWLNAQDNNTSLALATSARLRVVLDTTADRPAAAYTLYYKKTTDSTFIPVPVGAGSGAPVYVATSVNITASGQATTTQLAPPSGKTTGNFSVGRMWDDENGTDTVAIALPVTVFVENPAGTKLYEATPPLIGSAGLYELPVEGLVESPVGSGLYRID